MKCFAIVAMKHDRSTTTSKVDDMHAMRTCRKLWCDLLLQMFHKVGTIIVAKGQYQSLHKIK